MSLKTTLNVHANAEASWKDINEAKKQIRLEKLRKKKLRATTPLITIHGYKGSVLAKEDGSIVWFTLAQASGLSTPDLALPTTWENGVQDRDDVHAMHTLKAVTVVPYLYEADIYGTWLKKSQSMGRHSYEFCFDWRRSVLETLTKFIAYLRWISAKHNGARIQVLAHSLGTLITLAALHSVPELFHSCMMLGGPFQGGPSLVQDLHMGVTDGRNSAICAPHVSLTFASIFQIAKLKEEQGTEKNPNYSGLVDEKGLPLQIDWYDIEDWKTYKLGPYSYGPVTPIVETHIKNSMEDGKRFQKLLEPKVGFPYPPITALGGTGTGTKPYFIRNGPKEFHGWDLESVPLVDGDGRIPLEHTRPRGIPHKFYTVEGLSHVFLMNDDRLPDLLDDLLIQAGDIKDYEVAIQQAEGDPHGQPAKL